MSKRMTFGWNGAGSQKKRKIESSRNPELKQELELNLEIEEEKEHSALDEWMRRQASASVLRLEDATSLSHRRQEEACVKAEANKFREALSKLKEAIELTPDRAVLYELQAQCFLELDMIFEAVKAAEIAIEKDPQWSEAYQTLGRCQMNLGEVEMAVRSFKKALALDPNLKEIEDTDLPWALELLEKKRTALGLNPDATEDGISEADGLTNNNQTTLRAVIDGKIYLGMPPKIPDA